MINTGGDGDICIVYRARDIYSLWKEKISCGLQGPNVDPLGLGPGDNIWKNGSKLDIPLAMLTVVNLFMFPERLKRPDLSACHE